MGSVFRESLRVLVNYRPSIQRWKAVATLGAGQSAGQVIAFVRNIILAHMLSPADFGVAVAFVLTVSLFEMLSDFGTDTMLIQAPDGDEPRLQETSHLWQFGRGAAIALAMLASCNLIAAWYSIPNAAWAFAVLAVVPLFRSLQHLDARRLQRQMCFSVQVWSEVLSQLASLVVSCVIALLWRHYAAVLVGLVAQSVVIATVTHLGSDRPYRWAWERSYASRLAHFGWPLLLNGVLMFAITQGDRILVGSRFGIVDLAAYSVCALLTSQLFLVLGRVSASLSLPLLAVAQDNDTAFLRRFDVLCSVTAILACGVSLLFVIAGPQLVSLFFGGKYSTDIVVIASLGTAQAVRLIRGMAVAAAFAKADTRCSLVANAARVVGFGGAAGSVWLGQGLAAIAIWALVGELLAVGVALSWGRWYRSVPVTPLVIAAGVATAMFVLFGAAGFLLDDRERWGLRLVLVCGGVVATTLLLANVRPVFGSWLRASVASACGGMRTPCGS